MAHYRAGNLKEAQAEARNSLELNKDPKQRYLCEDCFFLAMIHWKQDSRNEAHQLYGQAVEWMEKRAPNDEELRRYRAEAEVLLSSGGGVEVAPLPREKS